MGENSYKRFILSIAVAPLGLAIALFGLPTIAQAAEPEVVIAEFMAANSTTLKDSDGDPSDWVEIHNTTAATVNMSGWTLRDSSNSWVFPSVQIPADGRQVVFASGKNRFSGELHTNFKLSATGEYLALIAPDGDTYEYAPEFPLQTGDVSYGIASTGVVGYLSSPTPGLPNSALGTAAVAPPSALKGNSFQFNSFNEILTTETAGATIRYTLDGSEPTASSTVAQNGTVAINPTGQVNVLKAAAFLSDGSMSQVTTAVYVNPNKTADRYGNNPAVASKAEVVTAVKSLPAMVIRGTVSVPERNSDTGALEELDFEPVGFDMIDPDGEGFSITAGAKVFGNWSVDHGDKRNYRLKFSSEFGPTKLEYPLFDNFAGPVYTPADRFDQLELRGGSGDYDFRIANEFARQTILDMGTPSSHGRWVNLYIEGDYMGVYRLRERLNADWLSEYQGGSGDAYDSVLRDYIFDTTSVNQGTDSLIKAFDAVVDVLDPNYVPIPDAAAYAKVRDIIDPRAYVNSALAMWPQGSRRKELEWRFIGRRDINHPLGAIMIPNDQDGVFRAVGTPSYYQPGFSRGMGPQENSTSPTAPIKRLAADPEFKQIVLDQTAKAFCNDGELTSTALVQRLTDFENELDVPFKGEWARFPDPWIDADGKDKGFDYGVWKANMADLRTRLQDASATVRSSWEAEGLYAGCNVAPVIEMPPTTLAAAGDRISIPIKTSDDSTTTPTVQLDRLPPGLTLNDGRIVGIPTAYGKFQTEFKAIDGVDSSRYSIHRMKWEILPPSSARETVVLNEFNAAVENWTGTDATLGSTPYNGGDWFELVVTELADLRGWTIELWDRGKTTGLLEQTDSITFSDNIALARVAPGTIITVSEQQADDPFRNPVKSDWHLNANSSSSLPTDLITATTRTNFDTNADGFRIVVRNANGVRVGPIMGETESETVPVLDGEVWMRCSEPTSTSAQFESSSTSSTFGKPNVCSATQQTLSQLRAIPGDVDCSATAEQADVRYILRLHIGMLQPVSSCGEVVPGTSVNATAADVDNDNKISVKDALTLALCLEDKSNPVCPTG